MAERDGAAVAVDAVGIGVEFLLPRQHHRGECLVHLERIDVADREPGATQQLARRGDDAGEHHHRIVAHDREAGDRRTRCQSEPDRRRLRADQGGACAVGHRRGIARRHPPTDLRKTARHAVVAKRRRQLRQALRRSVAPDTLVGIDRHARPVGAGHAHRHDLPPQRTAILRGRSPLVGPQRIGIEALAIESPAGGDQFRGNALMHEAVAIALVEHGTVAVPAQAVRLHRDPAHHLDATGNHHVVGAGDDALRREVDRLLGRAALAVERDTRRGLRQAGREPRMAGDVRSLLADLQHTPGDDVLDQHGIDGHARHQPLQYLREQVDRMQRRQDAARAPAAERAADDVDEQRAGHRDSVMLNSALSICR